MNLGCVILDTCKVTIGSGMLLEPNVSLFRAGHPLSAKATGGMRGQEHNVPITTEEDCWLHGNVIVIPGVLIGMGVRLVRDM